MGKNLVNLLHKLLQIVVQIRLTYMCVLTFFKNRAKLKVSLH